MLSRKKKVISIESADSELVEIYLKKFLEGLKKDTLSIDGNHLCVETDGVIYKIEINTFKYYFNDNFKLVYEKKLPNSLLPNNLELSSIDNLYEWTNPVIEAMGVTCAIEFINRFKEQIRQDNLQWMKLRQMCFSYIDALEPEDRKKYIQRFCKLEIFTERDKVRLEYYVDEPISKIEEVIKNGDIEEKDIQTIVSQIYSKERESEDEKSEKKKYKRSYNSRIISAINLLNVNDIIDIYLQDGISEEELVRTKVSKIDILSLPDYSLLMFLDKKNIKVPEKLRVSSKDLINAYGRTLSGSSIYKFAMYGYIEPQDLIQVYEINKALKMVDYESMFEDEEISAFYTPQRLYDMRKDGKITPEFLEKYREMLDFGNNQKRFNRYSEDLVGGLRKALEAEEKSQEDDRLQENVLYFFNNGLCDLETTREVVTSEYIENRFSNNEMTIEEIFELYQKGIVSDELISRFYTDREIMSLYESGKLRSGCLKAITDNDFLIECYCDKRLPLEDFIQLYLSSNNLSVNDLLDTFELSEEEVNISSFIDETTSFEKIKELFQNLLIDYSTILTLHSQGTITDEQLEEIKKALSTQKLFDEISQRKVYKVLTSRTSEGMPRAPTTPSTSKDEDDFSLEIDLISKILGCENVENEPYSQILSYNTQGRATSLNNYRIFGNKDLDGIIILQKSKKQNAVFVMSAYQLMYFLHGKENESGEIEVQDKMKDKAYLKTIVGVEVVEHSRHFARNLVEASSRVSPKVAKKLKGEETRYREDVQDMVDGLREIYDEEKAKNRDDN